LNLHGFPHTVLSRARLPFRHVSVFGREAVKEISTRFERRQLNAASRDRNQKIRPAREAPIS
jgi:hypothetical protein